MKALECVIIIFKHVALRLLTTDSENRHTHHPTVHSVKAAHHQNQHAEVRFIWLHLTLRKLSRVVAKWPRSVRRSHTSDRRRSPSRPSPFTPRSPGVDPSLLVCAAGDSWTCALRYKSPSELDSGDSDLITAGNKHYQHRYGSGFIFPTPPPLSPGSFKAPPCRIRISLHWNQLLPKPFVFSLQRRKKLVTSVETDFMKKFGLV